MFVSSVRRGTDADKPARSKQIETEMTLEQVKEQLTETGKKLGVLTYEEIAERMNRFEIESDQMDEYYGYLGEQGLELISENDRRRRSKYSVRWLKQKKNLT